MVAAREAEKAVGSSGVRSKRLSWGLTSQFFNMASNAAMLFLVARSSDELQFGRVALVYGLAMVGVGVARSATADLISARYGGDRLMVERAASNEGTSLLAIGFLFTALPAATTYFVGAGWIGLLFAVAVLPIVLHEFARQLSFASYKPERAALLDIVWVVSSLLIWTALRSVTDGGNVVIAGAWVGGACVSAGLVVLRTRDSSAPLVSDAEDFVSDISERWQYAFEFLISRGTPELVAWSFAVFGTFAQAGQFRLAQVLLGPLSVVIGGARGLLVSELRPRRDHSDQLLQFGARAGIGLGLVPVLYLVALLVAPDRFISAILGDLDVVVISFAILLATRRAFVASSIPPFLILRILGKARTTTTLRIAEAVLALAFVVTAASINDQNGALVGYVFAAAVSSVLWWLYASREAREGKVRGELRVC